MKKPGPITIRGSIAATALLCAGLAMSMRWVLEGPVTTAEVASIFAGQTAFGAALGLVIGRTPRAALIGGGGLLAAIALLYAMSWLI